MKKTGKRKLITLLLALVLILGALPGRELTVPYVWEAAELYAVPSMDQSVSTRVSAQSDFRSWAVEASHFQEFVAAYGDSFTGTVSIAVIDTGFDFDHPSLAGKVDKVGSRDFTDSGTIEDREGHGTHIAGSICEALGEAGDHVRLLSLKALGDNGAGTDDDIIRAIEYAAEQDIDIINMSLAGEHSADGRLDRAIADATASGVLVVAAGNDGEEIGQLCPAHASYPGVLTIGSGDRNGNRSRFSNWGAPLDLLAPGEEIYSSVPGGYATYSGTSMSAGYASAAAALIKLAAGSDVTAETLENMVKTAATSTRWSAYQGYGFLDLMQAELSGSPTLEKPAVEQPPVSEGVTGKPWKFMGIQCTYSGGWDGQSPHGKGTVTFQSGSILELTAQWSHGCFSTASGREKLSDGDIYEGGYSLLSEGSSLCLIWCGEAKILKTNGDWIESTYSATGELLPGSRYHLASGEVIQF